MHRRVHTYRFNSYYISIHRGLASSQYSTVAQILSMFASIHPMILYWPPLSLLVNSCYPQSYTAIDFHSLVSHISVHTHWLKNLPCCTLWNYSSTIFGEHNRTHFGVWDKSILHFDQVVSTLSLSLFVCLKTLQVKRLDCYLSRIGSHSFSVITECILVISLR